jgi:hypothetical protein
VGTPDPPGGYARCNLDGRPVHPGDAKIITDYAATLVHLRTKPGLHWREKQDGYWQEWYCSPPLPGQLYRVVHEEWVTEDEQLIRRIHEIELADPVAAHAQDCPDC